MKTNNKWTVKDVITTVLLTVLLIGIHFVVITVYGKSIFQLRFISWSINVFLCPGVHADGQQGK